MRLTGMFRSILGALALLAVSIAAAPASAQSPGQAPAQPLAAGQINPTAKAVTEDDLFRALRPGGQQEIGGRISIPDGKAATLIRPAGREWREFRQNVLIPAGGVVLVGMLLVLIAFRTMRGRIMIGAGRSGQTITRFNGFERFVHWTAAGCFIILALTGLSLTFGRSVLIPLFGEVAFANWAQIGKYLHNYLAFPFMVSLAMMFLIWVKDNIPGKLDIDWIRQGGGLIGKGHPKARKFNAGQKLVFWSVILGGAALSVSGVYLLFPYSAGGVLNLQFWTVIHGIVGIGLIAMMVAHAYIGSVGMEGAFDAMGSGEVDLNWAKEHHGLWVEEHTDAIHARGAMQPAE